MLINSSRHNGINQISTSARLVITSLPKTILLSTRFSFHRFYWKERCPRNRFATYGRCIKLWRKVLPGIWARRLPKVLWASQRFIHLPSKRWRTVYEKQKVGSGRRLGQPFVMVWSPSWLGQFFPYKQFGSLSWLNLGKATRQSHKLHKRFLK